MNLTKTERLIIANQFRILEKLYPEEAQYYAVQRKALEYGYKLHYADIVDHLGDEMTEDECREVVDILDMYRALTFSFPELKNNKDVQESEIHFDGFDGNEETNQYLYAQYFILDLERFTELTYGQKFPDLNSHWPKLERYRKMLEIWKSFDDRHHLTSKQIRAILDS
jgi:uncharacterized protein YfbU (UPF0304 family)